MRVRRWFARRFRTRVRFFLGREECWYVERPDWWRRGATSGISDTTVEAARARLDAWQDDRYRISRRRRAK